MFEKYFEKYTGREIAIFTDVHGLHIPLQAALEDIKKRGILEIYSLGDNIGVGPESGKVIDLLEQYGVKSVAGNTEDYFNLGYEAFSYFKKYPYKADMYDWTRTQLDQRQLGIIEAYPHFYELVVGGEKIALCHFANDVRCDYTLYSTWSYQRNFSYGADAWQQFLYTNSDAQKERINSEIERLGEDNPVARGFVSARNEPLFDGKSVDSYDHIFQGHVHFRMYEEGGKTKFHTIRGLGIAYDKNEPIDCAHYVILKEKTNNRGFDVEKVFVKFDRKSMECSIKSSDGDMYEIERFTSRR